MSRTKPLVVFLACAFLSVNGCALHNRAGLPCTDQLVRDQLVFKCDFRLPRRHRLLDELAARRIDISERLLLPTSDEPINVYLFENESRFRKYMAKHHPSFPRRRAFFVKNDTNLNVYAYWGEQVGEDLRHEVSHGYLHSVVPNMPLWLDEGLAEYFEVPRGKDGFNRRHIYHLVSEVKENDWKPNLQKLEKLSNANQMTQIDYAESWLWVNFLMRSAENARLVQNQLARLRMMGNAEPLSAIIDKEFEDVETLLLDHLAVLADQL